MYNTEEDKKRYLDYALHFIADAVGGSSNYLHEDCCSKVVEYTRPPQQFEFALPVLTTLLGGKCEQTENGYRVSFCLTPDYVEAAINNPESLSREELIKALNYIHNERPGNR